MATELPAVQIRNLNHGFGEGALRKQLLFDINLDIGAGEIVILTGPSGSGKTTLLTLCGALRSVQEGSVMVLGQELNGAGRERMNLTREQIGFIFQAHHLLGALTVRQNVALSLGLDKSLSSTQRSQLAAEMLEAVGLGDRLDHYPENISGGQKQRAAVARALVRSPKIVLADEPTASLDRKSGREVIEQLLRIARKQGCSILLVTHDPRILDIADRTVHLEDGVLQSDGQGVKPVRENALAILLELSHQGCLSDAIESQPFPQVVDTLDRLIPELTACLQLFGSGSQESAGDLLVEFLNSVVQKVGQMVHATHSGVYMFDLNGLTLRPFSGTQTSTPDWDVLADHNQHTINVWLQRRTGELVGALRMCRPRTEPSFTTDETAMLQAATGGLGILLEACVSFPSSRQKAPQ